MAAMATILHTAVQPYTKGDRGILAKKNYFDEGPCHVYLSITIEKRLESKGEPEGTTCQGPNVLPLGSVLDHVET